MFSEIFKEVSCYNGEILKQYIYIYIYITLAEKTDKVSIVITSSDFILFSFFLGAPQRPSLCSLFLMYQIIQYPLLVSS